MMIECLSRLVRVGGDAEMANRRNGQGCQRLVEHASHIAQSGRSEQYTRLTNDINERRNGHCDGHSRLSPR